jgi:DNA replication licensing factor MCM4
MAEGAAPSSSPIFFQSSPTKGNNDAETPDERMADASSTVDDGDRTPRGNPGVRGMNFILAEKQLFFIKNIDP